MHAAARLHAEPQPTLAAVDGPFMPIGPLAVGLILLVLDDARMARLDGLPSLAAQLFQRGTCCQVITPSSAAELDACLQRHGCERCLPLRLCGDQAALPEPDGLLLAASRLAIAPRRCLAIVDGPRGLEAARAAGCGTLRLGRRPDRPSWVGAEIRAIAHFIAGQRT